MYQENDGKRAPRDPKTDSGIPVEKVYGPMRTEEATFSDKVGNPGEYPYTRGIYPEMYRTKTWTMRQYSGFGSASDTNARFKYLLSRGQTGLSVAFDLPTQLGLDSDSPRANGEVGKVGVAVSTLDNMEALFAGIPVDRVSTSMTINSTASTMLAMYIATAEARGFDKSVLRGTIQNDMLKEYAARNTYIYPPEESFNLCIDIILYCAREMPRWHPISISGYHIREAGANAVQELAFTFADAIEYVSAANARGVPVDTFCPQLSFFFAVRNDFVEEIAKFRAARRIWAKIVKERFYSTNKESMKLRFHAQTSGESLTAQQPLNNIVRVSVQALAAVLGGAQSLHTNSYDEALGLPTEEAVSIALRTQQIIAEESGVTKTVDPLGGSYYLEALTDEIEARVTEELARVDRLGGALAAIKANYFQNEIQKSAYAFQKEVDSGERTIVGVNRFSERRDRESSPSFRKQRISEASVKAQIRSLKRFRAERDSTKSEASLSRLEEAADKLKGAAGRKSQGKDNNLMYLILDAVRAKATTGEIGDALRMAYGDYHARLGIE
ncbi:MAG TPA: methylmalonyl-CoA mutase family protein [Nitrososphaerales archaeon]|nr:methylmalonyl-CoA mutase family protein [Nitrososphaerales archaeon]